MTRRSRHTTVRERPFDTAKPQVIGYNGCRLGLAAEKHVPQACLPTPASWGDRIGGGYMTREEWRDVVGYEGFYQVSDQGRVRSVDRYIGHNKGGKRLWRGRMLKPSKTPEGYNSVALYKNGKQCTFYIHRLVAEAFLEPDPSRLHVDHINAIRNDNRAENLRWVTPSENNKHIMELGNRNVEQMRAHGCAIVKKHGTPTPPKPVIRSDGAWYKSCASAARAICTSTGNVSDVARGVKKSIKGYTFTFAEQAS